MTGELWEILVPCQRNNGRPFSTKHHREWDKRVRALSKGLTIMTPAKGQWISAEGKLYEDRVIPVRIACGEKTIRRVMDITAQHYDQKAVMAYRVSDLVIIKDYPAPSTKKEIEDYKNAEEHVREAAFWAKRVGMYGTLYIMRDAKGGYYLAERTYSGPEIEWNTRFRFDTRQEAEDVKKAGIALDWFNCLDKDKK